MNKRRALTIAILLLTCLTAGVAGAQTRPTTLKQAADGQFMIGAAITTKQLHDPAKKALILEQFNCLTPEYELFPLMVEPSPGRFTFQAADEIVDFAHEHDMPISGHMLLWQQLTPPWMFEDADHKPLPRDKALTNLKTHIQGVMTHFKGKMRDWDVANEAISDNKDEYLRDTPALRAIGEDYVQKAFEFAHEADPDAVLYYNDYNVEDPVKLPKVVKLLRSLKAAGCRLDAVGIQGHWLIDYPSAKTIENGIETLAKEGLKVIVTEMDIDMLPRNGADPYVKGIPDEQLQRQARRYAEIFEVFKRHHDVIPRVTFWGVEDGQSWLNDDPTKGRMNYPLLFDRKLQPKPAFQAVIDELLKQ